MPEPSPAPRRAVRLLALPAVVATSAVLATMLHRTGHTQGDDFALYLRQARSIFDGDIAQVVADNRFSVLNSDGSFSPIAYPWVWPLLLSPFVHVWGLDYDRLKLVSVALFCLWLVLLHGIVTRRIGWWPALAIVAVFGTAPVYLDHTDQLITEIPHLAAVALVIWWYDRIRRDATLLTATTAALAALGGLVALAFNVRRESVALLVVIAVMIAYDVVTQAITEARTARFEGVVRIVRGSWRTIATPFVAFAVSAVLAQLLLPTDLLPDNGNGAEFIDDRLSEYPAILSEQLGLGEHTAVGVVLLLVAAVGVVIGLRRRPTLDGPLAVLAVFTALTIGTHFRQVDRYWFQVTPWVLYFTTVTLLAAAGMVLRHRRRITTVAALVPLLALVVAHLVVLRGDIGDNQDFNDAGRVQSGPSSPVIAPIFTAVDELTPPDAIIAYFRARTMTLMTDRRSLQTSSLDRIAERADFYAQRRNSTYWQPDVTDAVIRRAGFEQVWANQQWILWRVPEPNLDAAD